MSVYAKSYVASGPADSPSLPWHDRRHGREPGLYHSGYLVLANSSLRSYMLTPSLGPDVLGRTCDAALKRVRPNSPLIVERARPATIGQPGDNALLLSSYRAVSAPGENSLYPPRPASTTLKGIRPGRNRPPSSQPKLRQQPAPLFSRTRPVPTVPYPYRTA
jgi:hypothetical protein